MDKELAGRAAHERESRVIAELLLTDPDEQTWQEQIVGTTFYKPLL